MEGYEIPTYSRQSKGLPDINIISLDQGEVINSVIPLSAESAYKYFVFATKKGLVKRTKIDEFNNIRVTGKICIKLKSEDELIGVKKTDGTDNILLASETGKMVVFLEDQIRTMGRTASGVKGINLDNSKCIGLEVAKDDSNIIIITENGYGKKTLVSEYRKTKRGSKGVKALSVTEKNGKIKSFKRIEPNDKDIMIITDEGTIIRLPLDQISQLSRVTQGSRLIQLKNNQKVSTFTLVEKNEDDIGS